MLSKKYAKVDIKRCVACGACVKVCPRNAIFVWKGCNAVVDETICVGCGICARTCPASCISAEERLKNDGELEDMGGKN